MIVTDLQYGMDDKLIKKIDLMIERCTKKNPKLDALLLVEGGEGTGKTTMSVAVAYYIHHVTGRPFNNDNIFFKADKVLDFAQKTENQIIIYDEPALDMLSANWWKQEQQNLIKLLMTARKKRHFIILNITKFYKFPEYIVVDRAVGMIHTYSRNELQPGRFVYIRKRALEYLYNSYRSRKVRLYKKYSSFRGSFPDVIENLGIIDGEKYNRCKDDAIMSIGKEPDKVRKLDMKYKEDRAKLVEYIRSKGLVKELAEKWGIYEQTLYKWTKKNEEYEDPIEIEVPV